jgi:hypothetical protein
MLPDFVEKIVRASLARNGLSLGVTQLVVAECRAAGKDYGAIVAASLNGATRFSRVGGSAWSFLVGVGGVDLARRYFASPRGGTAGPPPIGGRADAAKTRRGKTAAELWDEVVAEMNANHASAAAQ